MATEDIYTEAKIIAGYEPQSLKAMCLYAYAHRKDKAARKKIAEAYDRKITPYIRAVMYYKRGFEDGELLDRDEYLSLLQIGKLGKADAAQLLSDWQKFSLSLYDVKERVAALKPARKPKPKAECAALQEAREIIGRAADFGDTLSIGGMAKKWLEKYPE